MNFYRTSDKDLYPAFEEICTEYSVDCYEIDEGDRLKDLKMKDNEYTPDTAQYIFYNTVHLTLISVTQCQSHLFKSKSRPSTPRLEAAVTFRKVNYESNFAHVCI
jgi:hypothetical protein